MAILRPLFIFLTLVSITSCTEEKKEQAIDPVADVDTLYIKPGSQVDFIRYRKGWWKEQGIFGHLPFNVLIADTLPLTYRVDSGMLVYNSKSFTARCFVNNENIAKDSFDYSSERYKLLAKEFGYNRLTLIRTSGKKYFGLEYRGSFYPPSQSPSASCYLAMHDSTILLNNTQTTASVNWRKKIKSLRTKGYIDGMKCRIFHGFLSSMQGTKDSICMDAKLRFSPKKRK